VPKKRPTRPTTAEMVDKNIALATKEARSLLCRLQIVSWASGAHDPKQEYRAVIAAVETVITDLMGECVYKEFEKGKGERTPDPTACALILKSILPSLKRLQPAKCPPNHNKRERNRRIAQIRNDICAKYKLTREACNPIITKVLAKLGITLAENSLRRLK